MAQAYTAPDWGTGEGISPSNLQSISNTLEGIIQGTDKAIHNIGINGSILLVTYVDGTTETFGISGMKGIVEVTKTSSGNVDTYTMIFTDGTTYSFTVTNGGGGGSSVIANPTLSGGEADLTALEVDGTKYKVGGGGGNADKVELTKAEYDALPESKLTDGKMYFVTDWNESGSGYNISTDEIETGRKFFDKKIYSRAYNFTSNISTQGTNVGTSSIPNLNEMASIVGGYMVKKDGRAWSPLAVYMSSGNLSIRTQYNTTGASDIYIVFEYTKVGE